MSDVQVNDLSNQLDSMAVEEYQKHKNTYQDGIIKTEIDQVYKALKSIISLLTKDKEPLYESSIVKTIFHRISSVLTYFEGRSIEINEYYIGNGTNYLLCGIKGIGKTYILKYSYQAIKILSKCVVPVYIDFKFERVSVQTVILEEIQNTPHIYKEMGSEFENLKKKTLDDMITWLKSKKYYIMLFADEIQSLYEDDNCIPIVRDLYTIGKNSCCCGILSGSSSETKLLAFKDKSLEAKHSSYPNLNHSVYKELPMTPIRDKKEMEELLEIRYDKNASLADDVFYHTAGISRYIGEYLLYNNDEIIKLEIQKKFYSALGDYAFRTLIGQLYTKYAGLREEEYPIWTKDLLERQYADKTIKGLAETFSIDNWADNELLYVNQEGDVGFLFPLHFYLYRNYLENHKRTLFEVSFNGTINGWYGNASPGQVNKIEIREAYYSSIDCGRDICNLSFKEGIAHVKDQKVELDYIINKPLSIKGELGLDGFYIDENYYVDIVEINIGKHSTRLTPGNLETFKTLLNNGYSKRLNLSNYLVNCTALRLIERAIVGFWDLKTKMKITFSKDIRLKKFIIITNKIVQKAAQDCVNKLIEAKIIDFNIEILDGNYVYDLVGLGPPGYTLNA